MEWLLAHAESVGALCGAALAAWGFLSKLDRSYKAHLKDEFASKDDFNRLEDKVDTLLIGFVAAPKARRLNGKRRLTARSKEV